MTPPYEDLTALRRDARTLDLLAEGSDFPRDTGQELLVDLLVALREEARAPLPVAEATTRPVQAGTRSRPGGAHAASRPRSGHRRTAAAAVVALVSLSLTGVAAAVVGDDFLAPIRAVIAEVTGDGDGAPSTGDGSTVHESVTSLLDHSREAYTVGDRAKATDFLGQARQGMESLEGEAAEDAAAEVASVEQEIMETTDSDGGSSADATESGGQADDGESTTDRGQGSTTGSGGLGGSGSYGSGGYGSGTSVAPGKSQPPGQSPEPGQSTAPGRAGRPGGAVAPPRAYPATPVESPDDADDDSDDDGSDRRAATPVTSGSSGRGAPGIAAGAGPSGRGAPEDRLGARSETGDGAADRPSSHGW